MQTSKGAVRFMHLGDLHLYPCDEEGACGPEHEPCSACIKAKILDRLQSRLKNPKTRPDLLLLAGDLTDLWWEHKTSDVRKAGAPLTRFVDTAIAEGITVVGIVGEHDKDGTGVLRKALGWTWLLDTGKVNRDTAAAVHCVNGRPNQRGLATDIGNLRVKDGEVSILLAHGDRVRASPQFNYYAMGHLHWAKIRDFPTGSKSKLAYPGHLFSYWDGCGKAWPVHILEGQVHLNGHVEVEAVPLSREAGAPETRRLFVHARDAGKSRGTLFFENAPATAFLRKVDLEPKIEQERDAVFGTPFRQTAEIRYTSRSRLREIIASILEGHAEDIFVSPAGKASQDRVIAYARNLTGDRFEEFVTKTYKRAENTQ